MLTSEHEGLRWLGDLSKELVDDAATDRLIDNYMDEVEPIAEIERLLAALRSISPGPDAVLDVPTGFGLLPKLDRQIEYLVEYDVKQLLPHVEHPPQRAIAEATVMAIDLRAEIAGDA
jgi:hypothetical protein